MGLFGKPSPEKIEKIYQKGRDARRAKDYDLAVFNLSKAAKLGHVGAMMEYAWMHYNGDMGEPEYITALEWFKKAAELGARGGMYMYGEMHLLGQGTEEDVPEALYWLEKAAELGDTDAMYELGDLYLAGTGSDDDMDELKKAEKWFRAAAEQGYEGADVQADEVRKLLAELTAEEEPAAEEEPVPDDEPEPEPDDDEEADGQVVLAHTMPHYNIGLIGHSHHGKTSLAAAVMQVMAYQKGPHGSSSPDDLDRLQEERERGLTLAGNMAEVVCDWRHYALLDCPGDQWYVKNAVSMMSMMDGAILVVSAREGVMEQTREHVLLARQMGVGSIVGFLNAPSATAPDELERLEKDIARLLEQHGYRDAPIVVGDSERARMDPNGYGGPIMELMDALREYIPEPDRAGDQPFLMPVYHVFRRGGVTVVTGCVEQGGLRPGDPVELTGLGGAQACTAEEIQIFRQPTDIANAGDLIGVALQGADSGLIQRGQVLAAPGTVSCHRVFRAWVKLLPSEDGGRRGGVRSGYRPTFYFRTAAVGGELILDGDEYLMPGNNCQLTVKLAKPVLLRKGQTFPIRDGGQTVGFGEVLEILE